MLCGWDSASALSVVLLQGHPARENVITEEFFSQQVEEGNPGELAHLGYSWKMPVETELVVIGLVHWLLYWDWAIPSIFALFCHYALL